MPYPSKLSIGSATYPVLYESVFKTSSCVRIKNGAVLLRLSRFVQGKARDEVVAKFLKWAFKRLSKVKKTDFVNPVYKDGAVLCTHNKQYVLYVSEALSNSGTRGSAKLIDSHIIEINLSNKLNFVDAGAVIKFLAEKLIIKDQNQYLKSVIDELNQLHFHVNYKNCRFKRASHRFGSCSIKGNINIAYRLLFAPREVFRYVCLHELAHLREFNHSGEFWDLVAKAMPNYKEAEGWLKSNGFLLG